MPEVSPELASKVLSADLRNLIKKVGQGSPLTGPERALMETLHVGSAPYEELHQARRAALTRKWITGAKLTREEMDEAGLPDPAPTLKRQTTDRYQKSQAHYAAIYERDVKNIKRLIAKGRTATPQDFPPLDEPAEMAAWFRRNMGQEPRDNLTKFERESNESPPAASPASKLPAAGAMPPSATEPSGAKSDQELPPLPPMLLDGTTVHAADMGLRRVQMLVDATFSQMQVALKANRMKEYKTLFIEYTKLEQMLRSWEKDIIKIQEGRGEMLRTREINTEIVQLFTILGQSFMNGLTRLIRQLAPQMPTQQQRELAMSITDGCFAHGKKSRWSQAWQPTQITIPEA